MLDHGQVGPATPASMAGLSPVASRRPSMNQTHPLSPFMTNSRRSSSGVAERPTFGKTDALAMTPLSPKSRRSSITDRPLALPMTRRLSNNNPERPVSRRSSATQSRSRLGSLAGLADTRPKQSSLLAESVTFASALSESALDDEDEDEDDDDETPATSIGLFSPAAQETINEDPTNEEKDAHEQAENKLNDNKLSTRKSSPPPPINTASKGGPFFSPKDLADRLDSNPKLALLKSPLGSLGGLQPMTKINSSMSLQAMSPPLLINTKCSGYFIEPVSMLLDIYVSGLTL